MQVVLPYMGPLHASLFFGSILDPDLGIRVPAGKTDPQKDEVFMF
jgi:hypothetical protein